MVWRLAAYDSEMRLPDGNAYVPLQGGVDHDGTNDEEPATPAGQLLAAAETVTDSARVFLTDLEQGRDPDLSLTALLGQLSGVVARAGDLAQQIAYDHRAASGPTAD